MKKKIMVFSAVPAVPTEISNGNSEIQLFENEQFGKVRFIKNGDSFWVVGKDVLKALDYPESYRTSRAFACVPDEWKGTQPMNTPGGTQQMLCLSEQGLYFFLGRSDKPKAIPYQKWIAGEVVPSIRKTGSYSVDDSKNQILNAIEMLASEIKEIKSQNNQLALENQEIKEQIKNVKPKVEFYDNFVDPESSTSMNDSAKLIGNIGRNRLFKKLREKRFLMADNRPYQRYITSGLFKVKGGNHFIPTTYVTPKGLQLIKKMLDEEEEEG